MYYMDQVHILEATNMSLTSSTIAEIIYVVFHHPTPYTPTRMKYFNQSHIVRLLRYHL